MLKKQMVFVLMSLYSQLMTLIKYIKYKIKKKKKKRAIIRSHIDKTCLGLEIGPSHNPIAPKKDGYFVEIIDHASADELVKKYQQLGVNTDSIEQVDYVWKGETYAELVGDRHRYNWIIASHMIEHTPDLVGFLKNCDDVLKKGGALVLAIPDYRFCFDQFRPLTGLARVLDAHCQSRHLHSPGAVIECFLNQSSRNDSFTWKKSSPNKNNKLINTIESSLDLYNKALQLAEYIDIHNWCFTPSSFELMMLDLNLLGLTEFVVADMYENLGFEFVVILKKDSSPKISQNIRLLLLEKVQEELAEMTTNISWKNRIRKYFLSSRRDFAKN